MSKFNVKLRTTLGVVQPNNHAPALTFEGGSGFNRDEKSELFLAAVSSLVEDTFYESYDHRSARIRALVTYIATTEPEWIRDFVSWLRNTGNLRSISVVIAAYAVHSRLKRGLSGYNRQIVRASLRRADEAGEFLGLWSTIAGKKIPQPVKRGIADAIRDSLNEKSYLKWRGKGNRGEYSFRDILNLTHVKPKDQFQSALFQYIIDQEYGNTSEYDPMTLPVIAARDRFLALSEDQRNLVLRSKTGVKDLSDAGLTWESLAGIVGRLDATAWKAIIPTMGYTALRMNLRNFVQAGVPESVLSYVKSRLANPDEVAKAGVLPMQYLAAYQNAPEEFQGALEEGLRHSLNNIPSLPGRTLILVDRSASMFWSTSQRGSLTYADSAAIFGTALAVRAQNADLVQYGSSSHVVHYRNTESVLKTVDGMSNLGGTETREAIQEHFDGHDRVIVLTDEQYTGWGHRAGDVFAGIVPDNVPTFTWNLAGYETGQSKNSTHRHTFGGLTDFGFQLIPLLERGTVQDWSFLKG